MFIFMDMYDRDWYRKESPKTHRRVDGFKVLKILGKILLIIFIAIFLYFNIQQEDLFLALFLLSFLGLIVGLVSPKLVIRWGNKRTRGRVLLTYGLAMFVFFILFGITTNPTEQKGKELAVLSSPKVTPKVTQETPTQFKKSCKFIPYKKLARNIEDYIGERVVYKGRVFQVVENFRSTTILMKVTGRKVFDQIIYEDDIFVSRNEENKNPRVLEDDIIRIYGVVKGNTSYITVLGAKRTLPEIEAKYIEIIE
ncbi:hypothetical protein [Caldisericum sp.]|uniref:hypothetical protein n=1 Tax=Caldisericum sp. TaxID=2499687 RepID=UPI003D09CC0D